MGAARRGCKGARRCPNCGADNACASRLSYSWRQWVLKACGNCRFVYLENPPDNR